MKIKSIGSLHKEIYYFVLLSKCILLSLHLSSLQPVTDPALRSGTERVSGVGTRSHWAREWACIMATLAKECVPVSSVCRVGSGRRWSNNPARLSSDNKMPVILHCSCTKRDLIFFNILFKDLCAWFRLWWFVAQRIYLVYRVLPQTPTLNCTAVSVCSFRLVAPDWIVLFWCCTD